jgi:hypothetical protein
MTMQRAANHTLHHPLRRWILGLTLLVLSGWAGAQAQPSPCGPLSGPGQFGPYDYRTDRDRLPIVESHHFDAGVESLVAGMTGSLGGDLGYTLMAFPNHHRALVSIMNLGARTKSLQPNGLTYSIECYFERATRFSPDDSVVRALFGMYLAQIQRLPEGLRQLEAASHFAGDKPLSHMNIGLTYFELAQYPQALKEAHIARKLGTEATELVERLKRVNQWKEPAE